MDADRKTIALLGQPNSGKSTLFNGMTGAHQHVGNWPGKTVERCIGTAKRDGVTYTVVDLPGTYSLAANSQEEIVTRDYIQSGEADLICILADASQLERSLFMLADYAGIGTPCLLLLNMMDVARKQGKNIDAEKIEEKLGIPVLPFVAQDKKQYGALFEQLKKGGGVLNDSALSEEYRKEFGAAFDEICALLPEEGIGVHDRIWTFAKLAEKDAEAERLVREAVPAENRKKISGLLDGIRDGASGTGNCKFRWIDSLLEDSVTKKETSAALNKFDKVAISKKWGKLIAVGILLAGLLLSMAVGFPIMGIGEAFPMLAQPLSEALLSIHVAPWLTSLICEGLLTGVGFTVMMCGFVFGVSFVFGVIEEVGYMARVSYVFDGTMRKLGLHGKAVMPFVVSFGCNIAGASGSRVLDTWGQRMAAIAMSWVVPCGSVWAVVGLVGVTFFGPGAALVVVALFGVSVLHLMLTAKVFGGRLLSDADKSGLIMELPPYHKPRWGSIFKTALMKMWATFRRAIKIILLVLIVLWLLSYTKSGDITDSIVYKIGTKIEPVTMFFGLRWQTFIAWVVSIFGKEGALGVLTAAFSNRSVISAVAGTVKAADSATISSMMTSAMTKPEALAFLFAFYFNIPCLMTLSASIHETGSIKWSLRVTVYYFVVSLLLACAVYHLGLLIW